MSLLVSYEVKACHYHDSIILTLPAKLPGVPKEGSRREGGGGVGGVGWGGVECNLQENSLASPQQNRLPPPRDGAGMGRDQLNSHSYFSSIVFDDERLI